MLSSIEWLRTSHTRLGGVAHRVLDDRSHRCVSELLGFPSLVLVPPELSLSRSGGPTSQLRRWILLLLTDSFCLLCLGGSYDSGTLKLMWRWRIKQEENLMWAKVCNVPLRVMFISVVGRKILPLTGAFPAPLHFKYLAHTLVNRNTILLSKVAKKLAVSLSAQRLSGLVSWC